MVDIEISIPFHKGDYPVNDNYQAEVLESMVKFAAECYNSDFLWKPTLAAMKSDFPGLEVIRESPLDELLFLLFNEGHYFDDDFEQGLRMYSKKANANLSELELKAARYLYEVGLKLSREFAEKYKNYFEQALDEDLHAPNYAFIKACEKAGLPITNWAKWWPEEFAYLYYYVYDDKDEKPGDSHEKV